MNWRLLTFPALLALMMNLNACADDVVDLCETNPTHPSCTDEVDCEENPEHESCVDPVVDCEENPEHESCVDPVVDCEENPEHESCVAACNPDGFDPLVLAEINPQSSLYDYEAQPVVDVIDADRDTRILTFKAGGSPGQKQLTSRLYLDLDTNVFLDINDCEALSNSDWDIAFDNIGWAYSNSGQSGPGGLRIATIEAIEDLDDFLEIPTPSAGDLTWNTDAYLDEDGEVIESRFLGVDYHYGAVGPWFQYDFIDHTTDPELNAYVVYNFADNHNIYGFKFLSYDAGSKEIELVVSEFPAPVVEP